MNIEHWILEQTIDFNSYKSEPVFSEMRLITSDILTPFKTIRQFNHLQQNEIACYDNLINFYEQTCDSTFYHIRNTVRRDIVKGIIPNTYFISIYYLNPTGIYYER